VHRARDVGAFGEQSNCGFANRGAAENVLIVCGGTVAARVGLPTLTLGRPLCGGVERHQTAEKPNAVVELGEPASLRSPGAVSQS
jgi:hypothetical protein